MSPQDDQNLDQYGDPECYPQFLRYPSHRQPSLSEKEAELETASDLRDVDYEINVITRFRKTQARFHGSNGSSDLAA